MPTDTHVGPLLIILCTSTLAEIIFCGIVFFMAKHNAEHRVLMALPDWAKWPRILRRVYLLLPSHGTGKGGMVSMAHTLQASVTNLQELIDDCPTFKKAYTDYEATGDYPEYPRTDGTTRPGNCISHALLLDQYMAESATALYMQAEDSLPATMVKQALETVAEEIKNDPSLAMMKKTEQQKRDERDEATRTQLPTFDVMVEETKEAAESAAD
jgi:hypothetical protein